MLQCYYMKDRSYKKKGGAKQVTSVEQRKAKKNHE